MYAGTGEQEDDREKGKRRARERAEEEGKTSRMARHSHPSVPAFSIFHDTPLLHYACRDEKMENTAVLSAGMLYEI